MGDFVVRGWRFIACVLVGLGCAVVGMLPWLVHGGRLVLQNLWATPTTDPADMPIVLLPFSQYQLDLVAATVIVGSAIAGGVTRILVARNVPQARVAIVVGVLLAQLAALVQTASAVGAGLGHPDDVVRLIDDSLAYLIIMIAWIVITIAIGGLVFVLLTRTPRAGSGTRASAAAVIGVAIAAVVLEAWVRGFVVPISEEGLGSHDVGLFVARWAPAAVVGVAIVWAGVDSVRRGIAAVASLVVLWLGTAAVTALSGTAGSRALARLATELVDYFGGLFVAVVRGESLKLVLVAAGIAVVGLLVRLSLVRTRRA